MSEIERLQAVRLQRRETAAIIQEAEAWVKVHRRDHVTAFSALVELYLCSMNVDTVEELAEIEADARAYFQQLQGSITGR